MDSSPSASRVPFPVELDAPDITPYAKGNTGVPYFTTLKSGRAGPHAMIVALTHGNEICGAVALDYLFKEGLCAARGRITLGFANHEAFAGFDAQDPLASRYIDEDFNRLWETGTLDGRRTSWELARAREIRPLIGKADALLDIHSMQHPSEPLLLSGPTAKGRRLARDLGFPSLIVADEGHAAGRRMRDSGAFAIPSSPRNALLVECGQHWAKVSADVAIETALRFLDVAGVIDPAFAAARLPATPRPRPRLIEVTDAVTVQSNHFSFVGPYTGLEVVEKAGTLIGKDGMTEVRTPYDHCVLIMPSRRLTRGQTAVRLGRYVD